MNGRWRFLAAVVVSVQPFNALRCALYRSLFRYSVNDARIGFGTVIAARKVELNGCTIGRFNRFKGPMDLSIAPGAHVETHNVFDCGEWAADAEHFDRYERCLVIESNARITDHHVFDVAGRFVLGRGSWIAGRGSQFWTHGIDVADRNISIGRDCYIGSAVRFAPGSGVADNVVVGLGSVVTTRLEASDVVIAGCPARVVGTGRRWRRMGDERRPGGNQPGM
jgi:acetyltransferase-like isoleucine patch superfamily enzyme